MTKHTGTVIGGFWCKLLYYTGGYIGIMEKKMETTIVYRVLKHAPVASSDSCTDESKHAGGCVE